MDKQTEFVVGVFDRPITPKQVENIIGGKPLNLDRDPWQDRVNQLKAAGMLVGWGTSELPLGYGYDQKGDNAPLSGTFVEESNWTSRAPRGRVWVIGWTRGGGHLSGRFYPAIAE